MAPLRVAFDARALELPELAERGIGRYVRCLLGALRDEPVELAVLGHLDRPPAPARISELWEHALLARDVRAAAVDVLHQPTIDLVSRRPGAPLVVTVHDLVPLKQPGRYLRTGLKHRIRYDAVRRAARVIVPSRAVADDCVRLLGLPEARVVVVSEAAAPELRPDANPRETLHRLALPERFLVWVGGLDPPDPRKGVKELVEAVRRREDGPPLVLAGRIGAEAANLAVPGRTQLAGRLTDDELAALYSAADALVFPSSDEGFGLPPLEALACGTPVAAFDVPALRETLADEPGARLVAAGDYDALLDTAAELAGLRAEPPKRTWSDVARETIQVYEAAAQ